MQIFDIKQYEIIISPFDDKCVFPKNLHIIMSNMMNKGICNPGVLMSTAILLSNLLIIPKVKYNSPLFNYEKYIYKELIKLNFSSSQIKALTKLIIMNFKKFA